MELNESQKSAAEYSGGHQLVLAGAGTGKTKTIIARVVTLVRSGVDPRKILLLTFTRRAAREMKERLKVELGNMASEVFAGTFHNFCLNVLRKMPKAFQIANVTVIDADDQVQLMKLARSEFVDKNEEFPKARKLVEYYSYMRNTGMKAKDYLETYTDYEDMTSSKIIKACKLYEERKAELGYIDFDDILHIFARTLEADQRVREQLKTLFEHILVDEFQDTNPLQWRILQQLMDPSVLFCVGDDCQSIYAFRGADFKNVHAFKDRVPSSRICKLEENYRSTQEILDLSNWLLSESPLNYSKHLTAVRGAGHKPKLVDFDNEYDEANWLCTQILKRKEEGEKLSDIMVLTRTARSCRVLEAKLIEHRIDYKFVGGISLLKSAHVKDLLSLARATTTLTDELAWVRYLTLWPRIGDKTAYKMIQNIKDLTEIDDVLEWFKSKHPDRDDIVGPLTDFARHAHNPSLAITKAIEKLEPILRCNYENFDSRKRDLVLLSTLAEEYESLRDFIEDYTLDPVHNSEIERADNDDVLTLITVHSAKGTESKVCYVISVNPGMYPHMRSIGDEDQEEEERRVLYVALTRAQDELVLTRSSDGSENRNFMHNVRASSYSGGGCAYLLEGLPEDLVDYELRGYSRPDISSFDVLEDFDPF